MNKKITVIGLGYVGLPLYLLILEKGYTAYGLDINKNIIDQIKNGKSHIKDAELQNSLAMLKDKVDVSEWDEQKIKESEIIIVCVPTPIDDSQHPNLNPLRKACENIAKILRKDQIVIIESTIFPGTVEEILLPIFEKSGLKAGTDFDVVHCPERIDPGNKKYTIENINRVLSGLTKEGTEKAFEFYKSILEGGILILSSIKAVEATKMMENIFRDVNIALVNEMAMSFDTLGIDIIEVIKGACTKPFAFMPHYPGCGVGGHCIPVDPYYLIEKAKTKGFNHQFLIRAREVNNSMPQYTVNKVVEALNEIGKSVKNSKIAILGLAYKPNVDDIRESPGIKIMEKLKKMGADLRVYDPYVENSSTINTTEEALNEADCAVLITEHENFKEITAEKLKTCNVKTVVDGRNFLNKKEIQKFEMLYKGIGR